MNWRNRRLLDLFGIQHPVLLAPMAGATNADLVVRVSNAGGLGGLGGAGLKPDKLRRVVRDIKAGTDLPFQVNLFAAETEQLTFPAVIGPGMRDRLEGYHRELGLQGLPEPTGLFGPVAEQLDLLLEEQVPVISFHFGIDQATVDQIHGAGALVICSATTVAEARFLDSVGVDAIIAQGAEAGGHRGTFQGDYRDALIGTLALVPQIVDAVTVPVIAAGGIMDARGLVAALALGASGVQMGTAFLGCQEAPITQAWRQQLLNNEADNLVVTSVLSGKPARGIRNRYITELEALDETMLPYPLQYSLSASLRASAQEQNNPDFLAMWSGQGIGLLKTTTTAELMAELVNGAERLIGTL